MDNVQAQGVHHVTFRVADLDRSRRFYEEVLGFEVDQRFSGKVRFRFWPNAHATRLVLKELIPGTPEGDRFTKKRVGLDGH